jgi:iron complex outermembrane receptor protein
LQQGLSAFTTQDFAATCFDTTPQPAAICSAFTRLAQSDGLNPAGTIITGRTTTANAGVVEYRGEVYALNYGIPMPDNAGSLSLTLEATHNSLLTTSVTGTTFTRTDNTVVEPTWVGRLDLRYTRGPLRLTYQMFYLDETLAGPNASIENNPNPVIAKNIRHDVSGQYQFGKWALRAGINNVTDKQPSYPNFAYGDVLGRRYYAGVRVKF